MNNIRYKLSDDVGDQFYRYNFVQHTTNTHISVINLRLFIQSNFLRNKIRSWWPSYEEIGLGEVVSLISKLFQLFQVHLRLNLNRKSNILLFLIGGIS